MSWFIVVTVLAGALAYAQDDHGLKHADTSPVVFLRDVEVTARRGSARVMPEIEYDGAAIDALAAWDINEIVARVSGRAGDTAPPILIINGKRVADPSIFLDFPPGALSRLELLPPEAAMIYGAEPGLRVMNLVLEPRFESADFQVGGSLPTAGGTSTLDADLRRGSLNDGATTTYGGKVSATSSLRAGERPDHILDRGGDEAVTLLPDARLLTADLALARQLGEWSSSLRLEVQSISNEGTARLQGVLRDNRSATDSLSANIGFSGEIHGWQTQAGINAGINRSVQSGLSNNRRAVWSYGGLLAANRSLISMPQGDLQASLSIAHNRTSSQVDQGTTVAVHGEDRKTQSTTFRGGLTAPLSRRESEETSHYLGLGEVSVGVGGNLLLSGMGEDLGIDLNLNWMPFDRVRFNASQSASSRTPTANQLYGPQIYGHPVVIFDFAKGEAVQVLPILGGNPDLRHESSKTVSLSMSAGPFKPAQLFINLAYRRTKSKDEIASLTEATPAIEAAFPDRFMRDDGGRLTAIDKRPLNAALTLSETLSTNITADFPLPWKRQVEVQRLQVNLNHIYRLADRSWFGPGAPVVDRISGIGGGRSRQVLLLGAETRFGRWAVKGTGRWQSRYSLRRYSQPSPDDLEVSAISALDLGIAYTLKPRSNSQNRTADETNQGRVSGGAQIRLEVQNLFDARPGGVLLDGRAAPGFGRDDRDALGRTVRLQLAKRF